jgi:hypothetical protein
MPRPLRQDRKRKLRHFSARKFMGRQVKVTAKLEMKSNTIQISRIELVP